MLSKCKLFLKEVNDFRNTFMFHNLLLRHKSVNQEVKFGKFFSKTTQIEELMRYRYKNLIFLVSRHMFLPNLASFSH